MNRFDALKRWTWSIFVICVVAFGFAGCEGDDGAQGPPGPQGDQGPPGADGSDGQDGADVAQLPLETCGVCHGDGNFVDAAVAHTLPPIESVTNVAFVVNGADLDVTFDLAADGVAAANYDQIQRGYRNPGDFEFDICNAPDRSSPCDAASLALSNNGGGNYTIKVLGGAAEAANNNRYMFRVGVGSDRETRVYFYGDFPATPFEPVVVSAAACNACHGPERLSGIHGGYYPAATGVEPCLICHGSDRLSNGVVQSVPPLATVVHGYHSSMASWEDPPEAIEPHVTYPTYMGNCSVCHAEAAELTAANSMPVSGPGCLSCHGTMDNAVWDFTGFTFHLTNIPDPNTFDCASGCHEPGGLATEKVVVTDFHNYAGEDASGADIGIVTERGGQIVDGVDTSVTEGKKFVWEITGVADDGTNLAITWQATYGGVGVDPCNDVVGANAPVFFAGAEDTPNENTLRIYRNYAQGEDFILGQDDGGPGQPTRADLDITNTVCASNVATTTIPVEDVDADRGRLMIGGKPLVQAVYDPAEVMQARVPTPTFDWLVGVGGAAPDRRAVVDTADKCLACHVGSLYQHGGDRVDNVDACLLCHNSASNEQSVRVGLGVDESEAYDGKVGETFELKTMLHRIHSAGAEGSPPYLVYRNRGIYAFGPDESAIPNWPGTGSQVVFGSDFDTQGNPGPATINHNFHAPTYPRGIYDCAACHDATFGTSSGAPVIPDQTKAMATTVGAGNEACVPGTDCDWTDQLDDTLQGAATTACITCHKSGSAKGHAYQNSWSPQVFPEGRQTIIDAVK